MPDKDRERYYLSRLRECLSDIPESEPSEPEPPDFLFESPDSRLGIELTTFFYPPEPNKQPQQEIQSLRNYITRRAKEMHADAGGPALYVTTFFNGNFPIWKKDISRLARCLADAVFQASVPTSVKDKAVTLGHAELPQEILNVRIHGSVDGIDNLWYASSGGWVASIGSDHVQQEIDRKRKKAVAARRHCEELWLVIVNDAFEKGAPADLVDVAKTHAYSHEFDRLLWLEPHIPRVFDLCRTVSDSYAK
ncbi:hypothetical protein GEOBRER4_n1601 [Citrifermentans bremense]|uniref:Uncharacterized protein n=1 Tax=Citrifermentans bremense TaxID=60035 RepID=A0A6S6LZP6_9BACT|nr:hypothetical protein [Citrifermentans bremense]BCG46788.1 hypothetical protein GEOBRER4_n1601 [Citrifermentans bremense]